MRGKGAHSLLVGKNHLKRLKETTWHAREVHVRFNQGRACVVLCLKTSRFKETSMLPRRLYNSILI